MQTDPICHGNHEGPCDLVNVRYSVMDDKNRLELWREGSKVTLLWEEGETQPLYDILEGLPNILVNMALEAQFRNHAEETVEDIEDFLKGQNGHAD